ncbi:MAG: hypothetical protein V8T29_09880 [Oscillospiraceae bacterium]
MASGPAIERRWGRKGARSCRTARQSGSWRRSTSDRPFAPTFAPSPRSGLW